MGLRLTTKVQVSGWRFLLRRLEHAIVRRDTRMFDDPLQFYSRSIALGIVVAVLILAGAALLAYFKPQGKPAAPACSPTARPTSFTCCCPDSCIRSTT
ncbi:ESX-1 secretion system protein EccB1 [Mycobacterium tuberculosis]|nr:ESX-1 secretion system protein EccB1 [Mycobacterium tuberculosis]